MGVVVSLIAVSTVAMSGLSTRPTARTVPVGLAPVAVAVEEQSHRAFVANYGDASLSVLDARSGTRVATIAVPRQPSLLAIAAAAGRLFVAANTADAAGHTIVTVLDAANGQRLRTVAVGAGASAIAVQQPTGHVFVANEGDNSVSMLDARSGRVLRTLGVGDAPVALASDERSGHVFVVNQGQYYNGFPIGSGSISVLDARTGTVLRTVALASGAQALAIDERHGHVFVANGGTDTVSRLDARSGSILRMTTVGRTPLALAVNERTGRLFIANNGDSSVSVLDTATGRVVRTVSVGAGPGAVAVDEGVNDVVVLMGQGAMFGLDAHRGSASVLDGRTGRLLRTVPVGSDPIALTMDRYSSHAFVTSIGSTSSDTTIATILSRLAARIRRWLPWLPHLSPPGHAPTGSVTMFDVAP
jgi:YVTN family beta-propeller protein